MSYLYNNITVPSTSTATSYTYSTGASTVASWSAANMVDGTSIKPASLKVLGDAEFDGDVTIKGKSIKDSLERIEERLAILRPNEELEEKWDQLRGLRKMYMELEAEIIEKEQMWSILKK